MGKKIEDEELLNKLRWFCKNNELVTYDCISKDKNMPHATMYIRRFGSLKDALRIIGQDIDKIEATKKEKCFGHNKKHTKDIR